MSNTSIPHLQSIDNLINDISTPVLASGKKALRAVFKDHFDELPGLNLRPVVIKEIEKMINCQNPDNGTYYCCTSCNYQLFVPFTCKSRFCPSCGTLINKQRCVAISNHILDVMHRQWVFTIPKDLWPYFKDNWDLINYLFDAASETIRFMTKRIYPALDVEPGFIGVLHTFGRSDEDFEPHLHFIVTAGGDEDLSIFSYTTIFKHCFLLRVGCYEHHVYYIIFTGILLFVIGILRMLICH